MLPTRRSGDAPVDLKARRQAGTLDVLSCRFEAAAPGATDREAVRTALSRHATALGLAVQPPN
ncbi:MAG TPA: hypothetical protein P5234_02810 [Thermoanaerobaculaceae bacterium]|nr:hypothetical protein [Thermoanaerobaculaceae bacterium]HRS15159.1 hypothetical protein [Thermoanaerobaculaceae bacterium]